MATYNVTSKNPGDISREGNWIWNEVDLNVGLEHNDEFTIFKLPSNTMILGGVVHVVGAADHTGTVVMDVINVHDARSGAIVNHDIMLTALDLKIAPDGGNDADASVALALTTATGLGKIPVAHTTEAPFVHVNAVVAVGGPPIDGWNATVLFGLYVARIDYDKA